MEYRRVTLLSGHYGSGKTNIAVNMAIDIARRFSPVALADLDIVNPYFRSKDSEEELKEHGIQLICSDYANTNLDVPALPQQMYAITDNRNLHAVIDVGGDERGALALGRISDKIREEKDYDMFLVINMYRPLTRDAYSVLEVKNEIEAACRLPFTGIINCSNLGAETCEETVIASENFAREVSDITKLRIAGTAADERICKKLYGKINNLIPLKLQRRPVD